MKTQTLPIERAGLVTMKGRPVTLLGDPVKVGDAAPDFEVIAKDLSPVRFSLFHGKFCIISSVPSLDTSVCSVQTLKFNEQAGKFGPDVITITVSMDLPFAQKRWCEAENAENIHVFSDHQYASFGMRYGVLIKELRLLARSVFVVDRDGLIRYMQIVNELTNEPDYQLPLDIVKELL